MVPEATMNDDQLKSVMPAAYVVMGVSGAGKTTIAKMLSQKYGYAFIEGDDFHPAENVEIMKAGQFLSDENRLPWLKKLSLAAVSKQQDAPVIIACSALKLRYRGIIREFIPHVQFIHLHGSFDYIKRQMEAREGHFMPLSLLRSQFDSLEPLAADEEGITICVESSVVDTLCDLENFIS